MSHERVYTGGELRWVWGRQLPNGRKGDELRTQDMRCSIVTNREWVNEILPGVDAERPRRDLLPPTLRSWIDRCGGIVKAGISEADDPAQANLHTME